MCIRDRGNTATGTALLGAVAKDAASRLNMPLDIFVTVDDANQMCIRDRPQGGGTFALADFLHTEGDFLCGFVAVDIQAYISAPT